MKKITIILIGLLFVVLQLTVTNRIDIWGVHIDLLLIYAVIMAIYLDTKTNYITIITLAVIHDSLISTIFGLSLISLTAITYLVKLLMELLHEEKRWSIAVLFLIGTVISTLLYFGVNQLFFVPVPYAKLPEILLKKSVINIIGGLILTFILRPSLNHIMKNWW